MSAGREVQRTFVGEQEEFVEHGSKVDEGENSGRVGALSKETPDRILLHLSRKEVLKVQVRASAI